MPAPPALSLDPPLGTAEEKAADRKRPARPGFLPSEAPGHGAGARHGAKR